MARRYWTCKKCRYRQERRTNSRRCLNCSEITRPLPKARPAHEWSLQQMSKDEFGALNVTVHGKAPDRCAICEREPRTGLQRDHAHHDGGYPRGLLCPLCNKRLGDVEHGNDAQVWLKSALAYVQAAERHQFKEEDDVAA